MSIIDDLKDKEEVAIIQGLAMMSYIPSIGRVLESGGVDKFIDIVTKTISGISSIVSQLEFDAFHHNCVNDFISEIRTSKGKTVSYGQAQKPLNVFLKVFIDWAGRMKESDSVRTFLHVPLDSILISKIKEHFPLEFEKYIEDRYSEIRLIFKKQYESRGEELSDSVLRQLINPKDFSLERIFLKDMYYAWQNCLRAIYPEKPVLLDVLWSINR